jgi:hypothetical protein
MAGTAAPDQQEAHLAGNELAAEHRAGTVSWSQLPARTDSQCAIGLASLWQTAAVGPRGHKQTGGVPHLTCGFVVEPPAGIEPATPSLPWNHREPLCGTPFPQITPDRQGQSYRFSFSEVMRSLSSHALIVADASDNPARDHKPGRLPTHPGIYLHRRPTTTLPHIFSVVSVHGRGVRGA